MSAAEKPEHATTVKWQRAWSEWLPSCTCGWVGSYITSKERAEREASEHEAGERP